MRRPWDSLAYFSHQAQPPRRSRIVAGEKEERKKAAELWGFAAWNIRDGDIWLDSVYHLSCPRDSRVKRCMQDVCKAVA